LGKKRTLACESDSQHADVVVWQPLGWEGFDDRGHEHTYTSSIWKMFYVNKLIYILEISVQLFTCTWYQRHADIKKATDVCLVINFRNINWIICSLLFNLFIKPKHQTFAGYITNYFISKQFHTANKIHWPSVTTHR